MEGQAKVIYWDAISFLLKDNTEILLEDLEDGINISVRMDVTNEDTSVYPNIVMCHAPNKLLFLKSKTGMT